MRKRVGLKDRSSRGLGRYENYRPWVRVSEISSRGTTAEVVDWKHGRTVQCLSDGEMMLYHILRWNDDVDDINESFPLPLEDTLEIAEMYGYNHPRDITTKEPKNMTSDFLVWLKDGSRIVYSLIDSRKTVHTELCTGDNAKKRAVRTLEKLAIEKYYWEHYAYDGAKPVLWRIVYKEDIDVRYADNIRRVVEYYDVKNVHDRISAVKHLIAVKQIKVNMKGVGLDYTRIADEHEEEIKWLNTNMA